MEKKRRVKYRRVHAASFRFSKKEIKALDAISERNAMSRSEAVRYSILQTATDLGLWPEEGSDDG